MSSLTRARVSTHAARSSNSKEATAPTARLSDGERTDARTAARQRDARAARTGAGAGRTGGAGAPLGSNAKFSAVSEKVDPETGEVTGGAPAYEPMLARVQRFMLQSVARRFLPNSRTDKCLRLRTKGKEIQVWQSTEYKTATYVGLQTCGSVWACPVCAAKIAERRRAEVVAAMAAHKAAGGCMFLLTLTAPHQRTDLLADLLAKQAKALKKMFADWAVRKVFEEMVVPDYDHSDYDKPIKQFFATGIQNRKPVGEDVWFLREAYKQGFPCMVDPAINLIHHGQKAYDYKFQDYVYQVLDKEDETLGE